eukprot:CAMPEP_0184251032 /NCGR_PEP_ID=MMETSP0977-20130417/5001_1 /TAXON_ID=483370 /ORGANISM="non described non described, Strain CCMP2097" /LENGTH=31 /DNA_ID= /DNA_START= /DNA_END= /DNA_ORIENTATION=
MTRSPASTAAKSARLSFISGPSRNVASSVHG